MRQNLAILAAATMIALGAGRAMAEDCSCDPGATAGPETIVTAATPAGNHITLRFAANPVTRATKAANVCTDTPATVNEAKLWMPDMGHGSTPAKVTPLTPTCAKIEKINFVMAGDWEIRVSLANGDGAAPLFGVDP